MKSGNLKTIRDLPCRAGVSGGKRGQAVQESAGKEYGSVNNSYPRRRDVEM